MTNEKNSPSNLVRNKRTHKKKLVIPKSSHKHKYYTYTNYMERVRTAARKTNFKDIYIIDT